MTGFEYLQAIVSESEPLPKAVDPALPAIMSTSQGLNIRLTQYERIFDVFRLLIVKFTSVKALYALFVLLNPEFAYLSIISGLQPPYGLKVVYIFNL